MAVAATLTSSGGRAARLPRDSRVSSAVPPDAASGRRKPATDLRSCADSSASLPTELEVAAEFSAVCELISRSTPHVARDVLRRRRLLARACGNVLHQARDLVGHLLDFLQRRAGVLGEQRAADHVGRAALHRHDGFVGVGLNRAHQHFDLLGGVGGAFGEALHFVGDDREAAARLAGHRGLDRRVEREDVGLLGDVVDQLDDVADLLRALAQALDALGGLLDRLADRVHAVDRAAHGIAALVRDVHRMTRHVGGALGVAGHFFGGRRHRGDGFGGERDLLGLRDRRLRQVAGGRLRLLGGGVERDG